LQHDVERLIPRYVDETQGDATLHVVGDDDVLASDLGQQAKHVHDVGVLEVEGDSLARVDPSLRRARRGFAEASFGLHPVGGLRRSGEHRRETSSDEDDREDFDGPLADYSHPDLRKR
jgi:hypothetical protein